MTGALLFLLIRFGPVIGHAVEVAADTHQAVVGDAPLEPEDGAERHKRQGLEVRPFLGEETMAFAG